MGLGDWLAARTAYESLTETTNEDFEQNKDDSIILIANPKRDPVDNELISLQAVAAVNWSYHFKVRNYKDKKTAYKSSYYLIEQKNVIFTDIGILELVVEKIK